jgi:L,D-transpeptidase YcbB
VLLIAVLAQSAFAAETICATRFVRMFYEQRHDALAWFDGDRLRPDALALIDAIDASREDGLTPSDYHANGIRALIPSAAAHKRELDVLLTDGFLLLASHLLAGRVDPDSIEPTWCLEPRSVDVVALLDTALENHDVRGVLQQLSPNRPGYHRLWEELSRLRAIESRGGWPAVSRAAAREELLARLDLASEATDGQLREAVRHFQRLHGLADDGVVGPRTLRELNVPIAQRIRQVELNMERWRWLPSDFGERYGVINIPEFHFRVIDNEREIVSMRVVVGKEYQRTPIFSSKIAQVIFSPYWNVPDSIAENELWPKAARDRGFLQREHMEIVANGRLRQKPGPWNALGGIKFNMPNRYNVYLHDTPSRSLFDESVRTFSHGCIRIQQPVELALYLLRDDANWTRERVLAYAARGIECAVDLKEPLPVHVLYWTAFVGDDDELHFAPDVYDRDPILDRAMRVIPPRP